MDANRRRFILGSMAAAAVAPAITRAAELVIQPERPESLPLWPGSVPGGPPHGLVEKIIERSTDPSLADRAVTGTLEPRLHVFRPFDPNGAAVMIMPGGGYRRVVIDKEGYELGRWLAERGYHVFVLFYRLPGDGWAAGPDVALSDAQRAMRVIRSKAGEFGIDGERLSTLGFSAGGHLCADLATRFATTTYDPVDTADTLPARAAAAAMIYPVMAVAGPAAHAGSRERLLGEGGDPLLEARHSPHRNVKPDTPPCFLVHAEDDESVPAENSLLLRAALKAQAIPVETHLFEQGGHGFGLRRIAGKPVAAWPDLYAAWLQSRVG